MFHIYLIPLIIFNLVHTLYYKTQPSTIKSLKVKKEVILIKIQLPFLNVLVYILYIYNLTRAPLLVIRFSVIPPKDHGFTCYLLLLQLNLVL